MYSEKVQMQNSGDCVAEVSSKISKSGHKMRGRRSIKFQTSTARIKIDMSSTIINNFSRPSHSVLMDGSYSKWIDDLENQNPKTFKIRGYDRPIPCIISGHFVMYNKEKRSPKLKAISNIRANLSEPKKKKIPDSKIVQELGKKLEKKSVNILDKVIPFMEEMFANFFLNDKKDKTEEQCYSEHLSNCSGSDESSQLQFINSSDCVSNCTF